MAEKTYWNGEPCHARRLQVIVPEWQEGDPPLAWWKMLSGTVRAAVLIEYYDQRHLLDDEDGEGWRKVTAGHGGPRWSSSSLPLRSVEVIV